MNDSLQHAVLQVRDSRSEVNILGKYIKKICEEKDVKRYIQGTQQDKDKDV